MNERDIFIEAMQIEKPEDRRAFMSQACGKDSSLRDRVEALLLAHEKGNSYLEGSPVAVQDVTIDQPISEAPGTAIGRYKLLQKIGEGGMGTVFMAEQKEPVRRKVALKIIKPGMDTKEVIARFEAERQALALMDHPNIAKVLDAGATDSGRPYFVMDLVRGVPITDFCDQNDLTPRDRLALFVSVCQAVQHAHQKGIIHRDIKPSNVLVTLDDAGPVIKVIDFGVAKATGCDLTDKTLFTGFDQIVGTPMYMSPEQTEMRTRGVDTRSDIYSLGVLLYELLTGTTPFDQKRLHSAVQEEIWRIIREEEPPKPSTRISTLGESASVVAQHRNTEPSKLTALVRGDLDWIVMKALEKDRSRRYETAKDFADDVQRHVNDEPVEARPPSTAYRVRKFVRRNRVGMTTSALVLFLLILGIVSTSWLAAKKNQLAIELKREVERKNRLAIELKEEVKQKEQTLRMVRSASYQEAVAAALSGDTEKALEALAVAERTGAEPYQIAVLRGLIALNSGRNDEAIVYAELALKNQSAKRTTECIGGRALLAIACLFAGYDDRYGQEMSLLTKLKPQSDADHLLMAYATLAMNPEEAMRLLEMRPRIHRSAVGLFLCACARSMPSGSDRTSLEAAARDFECVQFLLHDNSCVKSWRVLALSNAIELANSEGRESDTARYAEQGWPLADELAKATDYPSGNFVSWLFLRAVGKPEQASQAIQRVADHPGTYILFFAADCLEQYDADTALKHFDHVVPSKNHSSKYVQLARAQLESATPNASPQRVLVLVRDLLRDPSPFIRHWALLALCSVCTPEEIREHARTASMSQKSNPSVDQWEDAACIEYLEKQRDAEWLLKKVGQNQTARSNALYTIAMMKLSEGDDGAYQDFKTCVHTNTSGVFTSHWARARLARRRAQIVE